MTEAEASKNLDLRRAEFEAAEAARAELSAAVDAACERQDEAEQRYDHTSSERESEARAAALAFANGGAGETLDSRDFVEADAELDRAIRNAAAFERDLNKAVRAKCDAERALVAATNDFIKVHVANKTARALELDAEIQGLLHLLASADGSEFAETDDERTAFLRKYKDRLPMHFKSDLWRWRDALKLDSNAVLEL
ncbi:MAG: hypothetical protein ACREC0_13890 [Methylocella sp.]